MNAKVKKSKAAIIQAGMELLVRNPDAPLSDIAQHAGVGRATLYRLFASKEELVKAISIHCYQAFDAATEDLASQTHSALEMIRLLYQAVIPKNLELQFLERLGDIGEDDSELMAIRDQQFEDMLELVEYGKKTGEINPDLPSDWLVYVIESLFYPVGMMQDEPRPGSPHYSEAQLVDLAFKTVCQGIAKP